MIRQVLLLSVATASIAFTICETEIFRAPREALKRKGRWLGKLFSCGYCLGHWVAFGLVAVYRPRLFDAWWGLDYVLTALVVAWLAAFQWGALCWLMSKAGK
jgi:hypothetical protein